jgi:CRP-like cAMP-binding protein
VVESRSLLSTLGPGQVFGEAALSGRGETRSATARVTSSSSSLMCLLAADYHAVIRAIRAEDVLRILEMQPAERSEEHLSVIDAAMSGTDLGFDQWKNLVSEVRAGYCRALTLRKYDGGETIYGNGSGEACDGVMVILDGAVEVTNRSLSIPHIKGRKHKKDGPDAAKHSHRRASLNNMMTELRVTHQLVALKGALKGSKGSPRGKGGDASGESEEDSGLNDSRERWDRHSLSACHISFCCVFVQGSRFEMFWTLSRDWLRR